MKYSVVALIALAAVWTTVSALPEARAELFALNPAETNLNASAVFVQINETHVRVSIYVEGLVTNPDSPHGIHIHQFGDISSADAVGGHYNPYGVNHGCPSTDGSATVRHVGDLGNWQATGGVIDEEKEVDLIALNGTYSIIGRSIVLHSHTDDCATVASSEMRLAAGVIGIANAEAEASPPATGSLMAVCVLRGTSQFGATFTPSTFYWTQENSTAPVYAAGSLPFAETRGIHVHTWGNVSDHEAALATGGHYDPEGTNNHALPSEGVAHHAGDMGNTDPANVINGRMWFQHTYPFDQMSLAATTPISRSIIGRGFILHTGQDMGSAAQPTGNSGSRQAQCVIGIANPDISPVERYPTITPSGNANVLAFPLALLFAVVLLALML